jgi:alkyldihydroxyacetonephosphate synthase
VAASVLTAFSPRLARLSSTKLPDRIAGARDLWQRRLIEIQHGRAVAEELPAAILRPETADDVREIVDTARREGFVLVPFGAGSGVCGAVSTDARTLVVDTKRLGGFEIEGDVLHVGPGALGVPLEEALAARGVTLGHFPSSILCSTVGGWVAARGAGQCSGRYGKIEDMLLRADCVLGTGESVSFRRRSAGLDLLPLLVGSEGTLGILTRLGLRLHAAPEERAFSSFELPDIEAGVTVLRRIYQSGLRPAVARLYDPLDSLLFRATERVATVPSPDGPVDPNRHAGVTRLAAVPRLVHQGVTWLERTVMRACKLVLVFEGRSAEATEDALLAAAIAREEGAVALGEGPARVWFARRYAVSYEQSRAYRHDSFSDTLEVAAPWSRLLALYHGVRDALGRHVLVMAHLSHAYPDGCSIYFTLVGLSRSGEAVLLHRDAWRDAMRAALAAGGTISHHHGVGELRGNVLEHELGSGGMIALRALKRAWDPDGLLCPASPLGGTKGSGAFPESGTEGHDALSFAVDEESGLVQAAGSLGLSDIERRLRTVGRTLALARVPDMDLARFVALGMPGARDHLEDPVDQRLAGLMATLSSGERVVQRATPRRATGPDLAALFVGAEERVGRVETAVLPAPRLDAPPARVLPFRGETGAAMSPGEARAFESVVREVSGR